MKLCRWVFLAMPLILPAVSAQADDEDRPFAEQQESAEFKQIETKQEMGRVEPRAVIAPGPEGGANPQLFRDQLQVLRDNRAMAVQQNKSAEEIAKIDAQIRDVQQQLAPYGR